MEAQSLISGWLYFVFFLGVGCIAGAKLAQGSVIETWTAMALSLLGFLEPESTFIMISTTIYGLFDLYGPFSATIAFLLWVVAVLVPNFLPGLQSMSHRPIPPVLVLRIGDLRFASPSYYNLILLAVGGALGYYYMVRDVHRYMVTSCLLVQGVLLPFAVRMYRTRLVVDGMLSWRNGLDDMSAFYLVASIYAGLDIFRTFLFSPSSFLYGSVSLATRWSAIILTAIITMEACLLGCTTRLQIFAVLTPIVALVLKCPTDH